MPSGVRKVEIRLPDFSESLKDTVAMPEKQALIASFEKCISLYLQLRDNEQVDVNAKAQTLCLDYFKQELAD
ncbi:MAG: hypothetical protein V7782_13650 [Psychromonas sp.]